MLGGCVKAGQRSWALMGLGAALLALRRRKLAAG
jgi:hypothetical protein